MAQVDQFVSITEAKNKLLDLVRNIKRRHQVVAITRDGVPSAVLLSTVGPLPARTGLTKSPSSSRHRANDAALLITCLLTYCPAQVGGDERPEQPRPHRALVIDRVAR